jgi:glycerophosphoryl diester phosphodiesterase
MNSWQERVKRHGCLRIGHRGAAALAPQNTLSSFQRALDLGVDAIEFDVRWTSDRQLVVVHSEDLAETTDGSGLVQHRTLAELRHLDAGRGQRIPTLDEALDFLKGKVLLNVDLKLVGYEEQVISTLRDHGVQDDVLVNSLTVENLLRVRALAPGIFTAISYPEDKGAASTRPYLAPAVTVALAVMRATMPWRIAGMINRAQAGGVMLYHCLMTRQVVDAVHRGGWFIGAWTIDDVPSIARMRAMGADSITSNRPDLLAG